MPILPQKLDARYRVSTLKNPDLQPIQQRNPHATHR